MDQLWKKAEDKKEEVGQQPGNTMEPRLAHR